MRRGKHLGPGRGETISVACHFLSASSSRRMNQHRLHHSFLMLHFVCLFRSLAISLSHILLTFRTLPPPLPPPLPPHTLRPSSCPSPSASSSLLFSLRTVVFTLRLSVSFSSSGGWRRVSPSWLVQGCCGNNSCHVPAQKLTEKNKKGGNTYIFINMNYFKVWIRLSLMRSALDSESNERTHTWTLMQSKWKRCCCSVHRHIGTVWWSRSGSHSTCLLANRAAQRLCWSGPRCVCVCVCVCLHECLIYNIHSPLASAINTMMFSLMLPG